jgi:hypothetical protein
MRVLSFCACFLLMVQLCNAENVDDKKATIGSRNLAFSEYPALPPSVLSVSIKRFSDWEVKDEKITVSDTGVVKNIKIYSATFDYKQKFVDGKESLSQIQFGAVFDETNKLVWFGKLGSFKQGQFVYFGGGYFWFEPAVSGVVWVSHLNIEPSLVVKSKMDVVTDSSFDALDKFVNDNFPYKYNLRYRSMTCRISDYFDNPNFTMASDLLAIKKLSVDNGLVRLDIGHNPASHKFASFVRDGSLWFDFKKGTLEKVEDRTDYPPKLANERFKRKVNN